MFGREDEAWFSKKEGARTHHTELAELIVLFTILFAI